MFLSQYIQNSFLPASERCKSQTTKDPTGPFDRSKLLEFLAEQGKNEKDWDHYKSYVPGEKKGKVWQPPAVTKPTQADDDFMVATEWDDVLANASESEIVELAGQLIIFTYQISTNICFSYTRFYWFNQPSAISCCLQR